MFSSLLGRAEATNLLRDGMLCPRRQIVSPPGCSQLRRGSPATGGISPVEFRCSVSDERRRRALLRVERALHKGDSKAALSMVKQLQGKPGGLRGFGAVKLVPKKLLAVDDDLKLEGSDLSHIKPIVNSVVDSIRSCIQSASVEDEESADPAGAEETVVEEGNVSDEDYFMYALHEAGHFLAGYLLGVLPKEYKLVRKGTLARDKIARGKVNFVGFDFLVEVPRAREFTGDKRDRGYISSKMFNNFSIVTLGGLVAEHLAFGHSQGLHADVDKLHRVIRWLGLTEEEADFHIRWAATNTTLILHRHREAGIRLAEAMASGKTISRCFDAIEHANSSNA